MNKVLIAITSYECFDYTAAAIRTALEHTPGANVVVIDDASPGLSFNDPPAELKPYFGPDSVYKDRVGFAQFDTNYGLTRSWNQAVMFGGYCEADFTVISNNDVLFTPGWFDALEYALDHGYDVASPITNAPGPTAGGLQDVLQYAPNYKLTDDEVYLSDLAAVLRRLKDNPVEARVNGYCWAARTDTWKRHSLVDGNTFQLQNTHNSRGRVNATPTMTLMEDEFQHRLYARGGKSAVCPGSFVFHYRSVWRGDAYKQGLWYRRGG